MYVTWLVLASCKPVQYHPDADYKKTCLTGIDYGRKQNIRELTIGYDITLLIWTPGYLQVNPLEPSDYYIYRPL
jgi:hypothetical protein